MEHLSLTLNKFCLKFIHKYLVALFIIRNNLKNLKIKNICFSQYSIPTFDTYKFYHCTISVYLNGQNNFSTFSGMDHSFRFSVAKSLSELCEGIVKRTSKTKQLLHRSGMGAHLTQLQATNNAYLELIERDSFLMHFLNPSLSTSLLYCSQNQEYIVRTCKLQSADSKVNVVFSAIHDINENIFYIGLSSDYQTVPIKKLIFHSLKEATMLSKNWIVPKFSKSNHRDKYFSILNRHLITTKKTINQNVLNKILSGGGNLNLQSFHPVVRLKETYSFKTRSVVQLYSQNLLALEFGDKWLKSYNRCSRVMALRKLEITHFDLHPLL